MIVVRQVIDAKFNLNPGVKGCGPLLFEVFSRFEGNPKLTGGYFFIRSLQPADPAVDVGGAGPDHAPLAGFGPVLECGTDTLGRSAGGRIQNMR